MSSSLEPIDDRHGGRFHVEGKVVLKVLMTKTDEIQEVRGRLVNACEGGLFVETDVALPPGALADLDIQLEGGALRNTLGLVKWLKPGEGCGIEFFYSTDEERDALIDYLQSWKRREAAGTAEES